MSSCSRSLLRSGSVMYPHPRGWSGRRFALSLSYTGRWGFRRYGGIPNDLASGILDSDIGLGVREDEKFASLTGT
jgi:hypothetical protein